MIDSLYPIFRHWAATGSVWIVSDTHFDDEDCHIMNPDWISPEEHIARIRRHCGKLDTLIHLGDVGNPEYLTALKCYKVLIMGNHDERPSKFEPYFNEIYKGPLMIAEKLMLSHEPCLLGDVWFNIHGHNHGQNEFKQKYYELNLAADVVNYEPVNLGELIKRGLFSGIDGIHRLTIDQARRNIDGHL